MPHADSTMIAKPRMGGGLHRQLAEILGEAIATGELVAGQQVVPEELAEQFGVSRTVVREVLRVLQDKGMVAARARVGTSVLPSSEWRLFDADVIRWRSGGADNGRQLEELLAIRGAIEPLAARKASMVASSTGIQAMREAVEEMRTAITIRDWGRFTEADVAFHRALLVASGSLMIAQFGEPIEAALRVRRQLNLVPENMSEGVTAAHEHIIDAIVEKDGAAAELASRRIVDVAGAEMFESLVRAGKANPR